MKDCLLIIFLYDFVLARSDSFQGEYHENAQDNQKILSLLQDPYRSRGREGQKEEGQRTQMGSEEIQKSNRRLRRFPQA